MNNCYRAGGLLLLAALLLGCGWFSFQPEPLPTPAPAAPAEATEAPAGAAPDDAAPAAPAGAMGGNLTLTLGAQDPPSLDPALVGDVTSAFVVRQIFSGLVRLDNNLDVQPDLAADWEISPDRRTYTFTLRENARFADGTPLTSEDVRYTLERATDPTLAPSLPSQTYLGDIVGVAAKLAGETDSISGVEVIDARTIALTIDAPKSYFLAKLAHPISFVVSRAAVEAGGANWTAQPNGSGPFVIAERQPNAVLVLARNENFYRELARLDTVTFLIGAAASNPLVLYEQGRIDVAGVASFALARVQNESDPLSAELVSVPQLSLYYIGMNVTLPPFDDPFVRQAFALLIDRAKVAEVTLADSIIPARGILPPGIPGYNPDLELPTPDLDEIRALLAQSRYGSAENLPRMVAYGGGWVGLLSELAEQELGITIEVRSYENFGAFLAALNDNAFQLYSSGWIADYPDPENFLDVLFRGGSGENHMSYDNAEVNRLLDEAAVATDEQQRWDLYREAERRILADAPLIPIHHGVEHTLIKPYVRGLVVTPMGMLDLATVELAR